ncbi:MAG: TIGR04290 family methyltransferase [Vicinamibacterales bacterium]
MHQLAARAAPLPSSLAELQAVIDELGPWFQNLDLNGVATAPSHYLGDYPGTFFAGFASALPADLSGWSVLDVGCNAGFYSFEAKRRGAALVVGLDADPHYLKQALFASQVLGMDIAWRQGDVYDVGTLGRFDLVIFTGVLYHLRHPLLALDLLRRAVVGRLLVFQSMLRGPGEVAQVESDYEFENRVPFDHPGFPRLHFVERSYAQDESNWWIPNRACAEAMLRSAGFVILSHPDPEVYICTPNPEVMPPLPPAFEVQIHG